MIITESVEIKTKGNNKIKYYLEKGQIIDNNLIVSVSFLLPNSSNIVEVKCDFCGSIKKTKYSNYFRNVNRNSLNKYACSLKCSKIKKEYTNMIKYGEKHPSKNKSIKEKTKITNLKKWGAKHTFQSKEIKEKIKETNLKKFGVDNPFKSKEIKEKIKETNLKKFGVDNPFKSKEIKEKIKETNLKKFGSEFIVNSDFFTNQLIDIKKKIRKTHINKYNSEHVSMSENYRKKFTKIANDPNYIRYINNGLSLFRCKNGHEFEINSDNYSHRILSNISICTICNPIGDLKSIKEKELYEFINSIYMGKIIKSHRDGLEIDIYLPELKLGFEFNGLYWHSDKFKEKNYHLNKTIYFKERGVRIIHIWEDDWIYKNEIIKSQIRNWLGLTTRRIFARKCQVKKVSSEICKCFLKKNHIQGSDKSSVKIGLYYGDELVSLMTFDKFEGRKKMEELGWNLSRFCNKINTSVIGGASKLMNYFIEKHETNRIVSYADGDWSKGHIYEKLGFNLISQGKPDYKYIIDNRRVHKSKYRKSNLNTNLTESQYMILLNILRIYDCGKIKFEKKIYK
jgi:hypothetical protein